jgi:hypothetical protein
MIGRTLDDPLTRRPGTGAAATDTPLQFGIRNDTLIDKLSRIQKHRKEITTSARIPPLESPYDPEVDAQLRSMMPSGVEPIALFAPSPRI